MFAGMPPGYSHPRQGIGLPERQVEALDQGKEPKASSARKG